MFSWLSWMVLNRAQRSSCPTLRASLQLKLTLPSCSGTRTNLFLVLLNSTLVNHGLPSVYGLNSARQVWTILANKYTSHARSGVSILKQKLQSLRHRGTSCTEFLNTSKICADNPTAAGKPVEEEDLISYIVRGLYPSFNPLIVSCSFAL